MKTKYNIKLIEIAKELNINVEYIKDLKKSEYVKWEKLDNSYGVEIDLENFMKLLTFISLKDVFQKNVISKMMQINRNLSNEN